MVDRMGQTCPGSLDIRGGGRQLVEGIHKLGGGPYKLWGRTYSGRQSQQQSKQAPLGEHSFQPFLPSFCPKGIDSTFRIFIAGDSVVSMLLALNNLLALYQHWYSWFPCVHFLWHRVEYRLGHYWLLPTPAAIHWARKELVIFGKMPWPLSQSPWWCPEALKLFWKFRSLTNRSLMTF